jgi:hypothetical protein
MLALTTERLLDCSHYRETPDYCYPTDRLVQTLIALTTERLLIALTTERLLFFPTGFKDDTLSATSRMI